jgi:hypothetical protein
MRDSDATHRFCRAELEQRKGVTQQVLNRITNVGKKKFARLLIVRR